MENEIFIRFSGESDHEMETFLKSTVRATAQFFKTDFTLCDYLYFSSV